MNKELIARFPSRPFGLITSIHDFLYGVIVHDRPDLSGLCVELGRVPGAFYVRWLDAVPRDDTFVDLCDEYGLSPSLRALFKNMRAAYHLTPESLADFMHYCRDIVREKENLARVKTRPSKAKTRYDILYDVPLYAAHVEQTIVPEFDLSNERTNVNRAMKLYVAEKKLVESFRDTVKFTTSYAFVNRVSEEDDDADIEPVYD